MPPLVTHPFIVNGRAYSPPTRPFVIICLDGSADEYLDAALIRGHMPNLIKMAVRGHRCLARSAMPSFTNVNNSSIVTGVPPNIHGISGNFFYDATTGQEVMMNSAKFLRAETIFPAAAQSGRKVAVITAKEKLRDIFASGLMAGSSIAFSSEKAIQAKRETHGIDHVEKVVGRPAPSIYSAEASLYVLWTGVALLEQNLADLLYLSTTDYMQHKYGPEAPESLNFYADIDVQLGRLLDLGAIIGLTADHGMNAKQKSDGSPNVIYLESELVQRFGLGFRVILPITDPYTVHHGALGSFAVIYLPPDDLQGRSRHLLDKVKTWLMELSGVTEVYDRDIAASKLELPADRLGELVVVSGRDVVLGRTPEYHDLRALEGPLRSHGGRYEEMVPFIVSEPLNNAYLTKAMADLRNFDIFDFTLNGTN